MSMSYHYTNIEILGESIPMVIEYEFNPAESSCFEGHPDNWHQGHPDEIILHKATIWRKSKKQHLRKNDEIEILDLLSDDQITALEKEVLDEIKHVESLRNRRRA